MVANPSTYVLPSLAEAVAYGFGCASSSNGPQCLYSSPEAMQQLKAYLALPLTIYLGEDDTGDENLSEGAAAMRQGARNALKSGAVTFELAQAVAIANGWPLNWRLVILPGVGHSAKKLLQSNQAEQAFGLK